MSMHKIPLTPIEEEGLRAHGLDIGKPSQLSDAFRQGVRYASAQLPSQWGEAVEVVAHMYQHEETGVTGFVDQQQVDWGFEKNNPRLHLCGPLMTVARHQRILAAKDSEIARLSEYLETERMRLAACGVAALGYFDGCADEYRSASLGDVLRLRGQLSRRQKVTVGLLSWAVGRWKAEVSQRPLVNVHRRSLDDTWRQVIRHLGGDPDQLCGPDHDALLATHAAQQQETK